MSARITIVCPHMGNNALGRALVLAQLAQRLGHQARVVGSVRQPGQLWAPALDMEPAPGLETFALARPKDYPRAASALRALLAPDDVVILSKPLPTSMGLALMAGVSPSRCVLDIDDWELGFRLAREGSTLRDPRRAARAAVELLHPNRLNTELGIWGAEALARLYPHRTVSNQWLQSRFGGQLVRHARDERALDPQRHDGRALRAELGIAPESSRAWVGFIGTPREHKGIQVLIEAVARLSGPDAPGLMLLGFDQRDAVTARFVQLARASLEPQRLRVKGTFALSALPEHVAAADILAIPSLATPASQGQIPAKLFDAMAMARPVVVSQVNDMPALLGQAGLVVPPGDAPALAAALDALARDPARRAALGQRGRAQFLARDSVAACARALEQVLEPLLAAPSP